MKNLYQVTSYFLKTLIRFHLNLSLEGKKQHLKDKSGLPNYDPGIDLSNKEAIAWITRAQNCSKSRDGGVAYVYSLIDDWGSSYPETTGYTIPTILTYAEIVGNDELTQRAVKMLDWLVSIQLENGVQTWSGRLTA